MTLAPETLMYIPVTRDIARLMIREIESYLNGAVPHAPRPFMQSYLRGTLARLQQDFDQQRNKWSGMSGHPEGSLQEELYILVREIQETFGTDTAKHFITARWCSKLTTLLCAPEDALKEHIRDAKLLLEQPAPTID